MTTRWLAVIGAFLLVAGWGLTSFAREQQRCMPEGFARTYAWGHVAAVDTRRSPNYWSAEGGGAPPVYASLPSAPVYLAGIAMMATGAAMLTSRLTLRTAT